VPPGDSKALAEALTEIIDDEALAARYAHAARKRYLKQLTAAAMVDATARLYERVLADAPAAPHNP
jgi:rhamnosyl/mannosyltransferase